MLLSAHNVNLNLGITQLPLKLVPRVLLTV